MTTTSNQPARGRHTLKLGTCEVCGLKVTNRQARESGNGAIHKECDEEAPAA